MVLSQNIKKFIIGVIVAVLAMPMTIHARSFVDVPTNHPHFEAISGLTELGVISGKTANRFAPDANITRAEAIKILMIMAGGDRVGSTLDWHKQEKHWYADFLDVVLTDWYAPYVDLAYHEGVVNGYPDGLFHPNGQMNVAEALKLSINSFDIDVRGFSHQYDPLLYVSSGDWFSSYFKYAKDKKIINPKKFYHPAQHVTRAEFVEIAYRTSKVADGEVVGSYSFSNSSEYKITIPRLGIINLDVGFADPFDAGGATSLLRRMPFGHYLAKPGSGGKFAIFGHSSGYAWDASPYKVMLRQINQLRVGDKIYVNYNQKGFVYEVGRSDVIPASEDDRILSDYRNEELALFTCWPPDSIRSRYVVYGRNINLNN